MVHLSWSTLCSILIVTLSFVILCSAWECPLDTPPKLIPNGEYKPRGEIVTAAGMTVYEVGSGKSSHILIGIHDAFGIGPNTNNMEVCDVLAEGGMKVVLPDFFHGQPWSTARGIPFNLVNPAFGDFLEKFSWENSVRDDLTKLVNHYRGIGFFKFGIFGYKFGGRQVWHASEEFNDTFLVGGQFAPAPVFTADAHRIKIPTAILEDAPLVWDIDFNATEYCQIVESNLGEGSCLSKRYENSGIHPFLGGAEADWSQAENLEKASDALMLFQQFLCNKFLN